MRKQGTVLNRWMPVIFLSLIAGIATTLITATQNNTRQRIIDNEIAETMKVLAAVLPKDSYDNELHRDRIMVSDPELLGSTEPQALYRARKSGRPIAVIMTVTTPIAYVSPIKLLVGISVSGEITGVRVIAHRETPGLGDRIEASKSGWLNRFSGTTSKQPDYEQWRVKRDGGHFDQVTGATVTSRAVVSAVRDALIYFDKHRDEIFEQP